MSHVTRASEDGRFAVRLGKRPLKRLVAFCKASYPKETGGVLVGTYDEGLRVASIVRVLGPPGGSEHGRFSFFRAIGGLQERLDEFWSKGAYYVGEWHFHPDGSPTPSGTDEAQLFAIAKDVRYGCPEPILIILGGNPSAAYSLSVNIYTRTNERIRLPKEPALAAG